MKSTKKLSSVALLSVLALTGCTNSNDSMKSETAPVATGAQDTPAPAPEAVTGAVQPETISSTGEESPEQGMKNDNDADDTKVDSSSSASNVPNTMNARATQTGTSAATASVSGSIVKSGQINYKTPVGDDIMRVSISTTKDGIITEASATPLATNPVSLKLQQAFANKISAEVVGKSIKGLKVDTVSGASLTTAAFNGFLASNSN